MSDIINSTLDDIAGIIGFSATIRLAAHYGGRDIHVPLEVSDMHPIAKLIGKNRLAHMHAAWAGQRIAVPSLGVAEVEQRNARILNMLLHDMSVFNVARLIGVSDRRVQQMRREFEVDGLLVAKIESENLSRNF